MNLTLQRQVLIGHQMRKCWVDFEISEDDAIVTSIKHKGRDMTKRVTEQERIMLCQSITHAEMRDAIYEAEQEAKIDRLG